MPSPQQAGSPSDSPSSGHRQPGILFARKGPVLSVETAGPRRIAVGKESTYEVTVRNSGATGADEVVVAVTIPSWAELLSAEVTTGATQMAAPDAGGPPLTWHVGNLPPKGREKLMLRIVPRESRPIDLAVRCEHRPVASEAMIEVQEPRLAIKLEGPREVLFGQREIYTLRLSNTGTGDAENVVITLAPLGTARDRPVSHRVGVVRAGGQKAIEVELTARQVGDLTIKVEARADAGAYAELAENVLVRRPALQVDVEGPKVQYVGGAATYQICLRNPGTAPAKNVNLSVALPPGAKYISGIDGSRLEAHGPKAKLRATVAALEPAGQRTYNLKCALDLPGASRLDVFATADGDLTASAGMTTRVEAIADLVLQVKDPAGPVPVSEEATYEIRVHNRGTKKAPNVQVIAYFSRGVEPTRAEGGRHKIDPGQVVFNPVPSLAPGKEVTMKVHAQAGTAGNHIFRAEVHCRPLETRLVTEETTRFYQADAVMRQASRP